MKNSHLKYIEKIKKPGEQVYDPLKHLNWRSASSNIGETKEIYHDLIIKYTLKNDKVVYAIFDANGNVPLPPVGEQFKTTILRRDATSINWKAYGLVAFVVLLIFLEFFAPSIAAYYRDKNDPLIKQREMVYENYHSNLQRVNELTAKTKENLAPIYIFTNDTDPLSIELHPNISNSSSSEVPYTYLAEIDAENMNFITHSDSIGFRILLWTGRTGFYLGHHQNEISSRKKSRDFILTIDYKVTDYEKEALAKRLKEGGPHPFREEMEAELKQEYKTLHLDLSHEELFSGEIQLVKSLQLTELKTNPECKFYFSPSNHGSMSLEEFRVANDLLQALVLRDYQIDACNFALRELRL